MHYSNLSDSVFPRNSDEPAVAVHNYVEDRKVDESPAYTGDGIQGAEVGGTVTDGITIEFTHDLLDLNIDFRSAGWSFTEKTYKYIAARNL